MLTHTHNLYGDESCSDGLVSYGFLIVPEDHVISAEEELSSLKTRYGKDPDAVLHCRILFDQRARAKSEWADKSFADVCDLYADLFSRLRKLPIRSLVVNTKTPKLPIEIPDALWIHKDANFVGPMPMCPGFRLTEKHVAAFSGRIALTEIGKRLDLKKTRFWADPDTTKIALAGQNRQASRLVGGHVKSVNEWTVVTLMDASKEKPALLQVADSLSYIARRGAAAKGYSSNDSRFKRLFDLLAPELISASWSD